MLRPSVCDQADAYILDNGTITINRAGDAAASGRANERNKSVIIKNWASFTKCISKTNDMEIDNVQDFDIVIPIHNLIEYSDNY